MLLLAKLKLFSIAYFLKTFRKVIDHPRALFFFLTNTPKKFDLNLTLDKFKLIIPPIFKLILFIKVMTLYL